MAIELIQDVVRTGIAPFTHQVGWQGFAYGLLGLKTIRRVVRLARDLYSGRNGGGAQNE